MGLDEGYDTILGPHFLAGTDLSIGQWQRMALARALFRDCPFIVLDEPTASLDARAERELFEDIRGILPGRAVLLISHRFANVRSADHIYVLVGRARRRARRPRRAHGARRALRRAVHDAGGDVRRRRPRGTDFVTRSVR